MTFPLTACIEAAMELARHGKLEDGTYAGEIPKLKGVAAVGMTLPNPIAWIRLRGCERELRSTLEDWILVGLRLGLRLPRLASIDLNTPHGRLATCPACRNRKQASCFMDSKP